MARGRLRHTLLLVTAMLGAGCGGSDDGVTCAEFLKRDDLAPELRQRVAAALKREPDCRIESAYSDQP